MELKADYIALFYLLIEGVKFLASKAIAQREQFKILHDISVSQENISKSLQSLAERLLPQNIDLPKGDESNEQV